jgi:GMP synthase-like glutamine amidotransferase
MSTPDVDQDLGEQLLAHCLGSQVAAQAQADNSGQQLATYVPPSKGGQ